MSTYPIIHRFIGYAQPQMNVMNSLKYESFIRNPTDYQHKHNNYEGLNLFFQGKKYVYIRDFNLLKFWKSMRVSGYARNAPGS